MKDFKRWLCESMWGSRWSYSLPKDPELQLYDFYMLNMFNLNTKSLPRPDDMEYMINEIQEKILPPLRKHMLDAVFCSIACEFRHVYDRCYGFDETDFRNELKSSESHAWVFERWSREYFLKKKDHPFIPSTGKREYNVKTDNQEGQYSYKAALIAADETHKRCFVEIAKLAYSNYQWHNKYGGEAWANICSGWLKLLEAKPDNPRKVSTAIDHVYDLQHNTSTVFDKVREYAKNGGYTWLKYALDFKRYIKHPYALMSKVSPTMKKIALRIIKENFGTSYDQWQKEIGDSFFVYEELGEYYIERLRKRRIHEEDLAKIIKGAKEKYDINSPEFPKELFKKIKEQYIKSFIEDDPDLANEPDINHTVGRFDSEITDAAQYITSILKQKAPVTPVSTPEHLPLPEDGDPISGPDPAPEVPKFKFTHTAFELLTQYGMTKEQIEDVEKYTRDVIFDSLIRNYGIPYQVSGIVTNHKNSEELFHKILFDSICHLEKSNWNQAILNNLHVNFKKAISIAEQYYMFSNHEGVYLRKGYIIINFKLDGDEGPGDIYLSYNLPNAIVIKLKEKTQTHHAIEWLTRIFLEHNKNYDHYLPYISKASALQILRVLEDHDILSSNSAINIIDEEPPKQIKPKELFNTQKPFGSSRIGTLKAPEPITTNSTQISSPEDKAATKEETIESLVKDHGLSQHQAEMAWTHATIKNRADFLFAIEYGMPVDMAIKISPFKPVYPETYESIINIDLYQHITGYSGGHCHSNFKTMVEKAKAYYKFVNKTESSMKDLGNGYYEITVSFNDIKGIVLNLPKELIESTKIMQSDSVEKIKRIRSFNTTEQKCLPYITPLTALRIVRLIRDTDVETDAENKKTPTSPAPSPAPLHPQSTYHYFTDEEANILRLHHLENDTIKHLEENYLPHHRNLLFIALIRFYGIPCEVSGKVSHFDKYNNIHKELAKTIYFDIIRMHTQAQNPQFCDEYQKMLDNANKKYRITKNHNPEVHKNTNFYDINIPLQPKLGLIYRMPNDLIQKLKETAVFNNNQIVNIMQLSKIIEDHNENIDLFTPYLSFTITYALIQILFKNHILDEDEGYW